MGVGVKVLKRMLHRLKHRLTWYQYEWLVMRPWYAREQARKASQIGRAYVLAWAYLSMPETFVDNWFGDGKAVAGGSDGAC